MRAPRRRWWRDLCAVVGIGVVVVGAALVPAVTANSGAMVTVRGDVRVDGVPVPFFPVGFWAPDTGLTASTTTDANGNFTFEVSTTIDGYAFAGTEPDSAEALTAADGRMLVRGVIGATPARPTATPLYAGWATATGRKLASGGMVRFVLQTAGRIGGTSPLKGSAVKAVQVRRLDGSVVQRLTLDRRGRFVSGALVPGTYALALVPAAPLLPVVERVVVRSGGTTAVTVPTPEQGARIAGTITTDGKAAAPAGVPVLLEQQGDLVASTTTASGGTYAFAGVAAGDYTVEIGTVAPTGDTASGAAVTIPAATAASTPTPTPTASPTPSPSPTTAAEAALTPLATTTDLVEPADVAVTVPDELGTVAVDTQVGTVGKLSGTVSGTEGVPTQVVVEDQTTGRVLRATTADSNGRYTVGGLQIGTQYTLYAVTHPADASQARIGTTTALATQSTSAVDMDVDAAALTVSGAVAGAKRGSVQVGDDVFSRTAAVDASGAFTVQGLVPGAFPMMDTVAQHLESDPVALVLPATAPVTTTFDLQPGPSPATFKGWFISASAGVPIVIGTATATDGDVARFGPRTDAGNIVVTGLRPGVYTYDAGSFAGSVPATDGPWWFAAPGGTFTLRDGAVTDVGPIVLHVRAR